MAELVSHELARAAENGTYVQRLARKDGVDQSAIDWRLACAAAEGGKSESDIAALIIERRRAITPVKTHLEGYAERTAKKAQSHIRSR